MSCFCVSSKPSSLAERWGAEWLVRAARAMLMKADILLLDEPTNHLDVTNVAWLENYLNNIPEVSSMIVSHDSGDFRHCMEAITLRVIAKK